MPVFLRKTKFELVDSVGFNVEISTSTVGLHMVKTEYLYFNINPNGLDMLNALCLAYILREKSLAIYFGDSQFRRNRTFNFIVSKIYVDKRSRVR